MKTRWKFEIGDDVRPTAVWCETPPRGGTGPMRVDTLVPSGTVVERAVFGREGCYRVGSSRLFFVADVFELAR